MTHWICEANLRGAWFLELYLPCGRVDFGNLRTVVATWHLEVCVPAVWAAGSFEVSTVVVACLLGVVPTFVVALRLEMQLPADVVATHSQVYLPSTGQPGDQTLGTLPRTGGTRRQVKLPRRQLAHSQEP